MVTGFFADLLGWRAGFMALAAIAFAGAIAVAFLLPHERKFVRSEGLLASGRQMLAHFRNGQLLATYAVGFGVLFNFICTFTYVSFHLAARALQSLRQLARRALRRLSHRLRADALDRLGGRPLRTAALHDGGDRAVGRRHCATLAPSLPLIILGLAVSAGCGLICQAISTGYVTTTAKAGRSSAVGLYVTSFYLGGSFGAALGGLAWTLGGWPACVALVAAMLAIMAADRVFSPGRSACRPAPSTPPIEPP